jgi:hypothetical protein
MDALARRAQGTGALGCTQAVALIDILRARCLAPAADCSAARALIVRIVQMLSKLIAGHTA